MTSKKGSRNIKAEILDAAGSLMIRKGVKNTTLKDIASEIGISKGTLYYYYASKEEMIFDISELHLNQITEKLKLWLKNIDSSISFEEKLKKIIESVSSIESGSRLHMYLLSEAAVDNEDLKIKFREKYREWFLDVEIGLKEMFLEKDINYRALAYMMVALIDGYSMQRVIGIEDIPFGDTASMIASIEKS